jgi:DNA-nicking Smr family endonuclease
VKKNKGSPFAQLEALRAKLPDKPTGKRSPVQPARAVSTAPEQSFADWMNQVEPSAPAAQGDVLEARAPLFTLSADRTTGHLKGEPEHLDALRRAGVTERIELHGLTREQAEHVVSSAIATARRSRVRKVLIVHGKGEHSHKGIAVLRYEMANFLLNPAHAATVLAFAPADLRDGGEGATVVLLR